MPPPNLWNDKWQFLSKEAVVRHWQILLQSRGSRVSSHPLPTGSTNLDMVFTPGQGWEYVVSLATPQDSEALSALGDEFVTTHSHLFAKEYSVDQKVWCQYLGLHTDSSKRQQQASEIAYLNLAHASRCVNFQALCHTGCTLKCEAKPVDHAPEPSSPSLAVPRRNGSTNGSNGSTRNGTNGSANGHPRAGVVGYVHFTLEEGTPAGSPRFSKRLKMKKGESTREYTKVSHLIVTRAHRGNGLGALLLTAMLHRVSCLDPSYAREIFLTVIKRNKMAVELYQSLALRTIGENTTYLGKDAAAKTRPIVWYQMGLSRECVVNGSNGMLNGNAAGGARGGETTNGNRVDAHAEDKLAKKQRRK